MSLVVGDILFARGARPAVVTAIESNSGSVVLDRDFDRVQAHTKTGIVNGLTPEQKQPFQEKLTLSSNTQKNKEIDSLFEFIKKMRSENRDPRLLRYLEGELQYRITKSNYFPQDYTVNPENIST